MNDADLERRQLFALFGVFATGVYPNVLTASMATVLFEFYKDAVLERNAAPRIAPTSAGAHAAWSPPPRWPVPPPVVASPASDLDLLGVDASVTRDELVRAYRQAARFAHPDGGGSHDAMVALNAAFDRLMRWHGWA